MSTSTRLPDLSAPLTDAGLYLGDLLTPTLRLGVTGLSRSGKTVFITSLVTCLLEGRADPAFGRLKGLPGYRAFLEPQPDDDVPRFAFEDHRAALSGPDPQWPDSTRRISQLRLTLEWDADDFARQALGIKRRLHIDIIDYPGEWLIDLGLLDQSFSNWSVDALQYARTGQNPALAREFLSFSDGLEPGTATDEAVAIKGAGLFTDYLRAARKDEPSRAVLGPGRFLLPGDLEGSPLLTFFPLPEAASQGEKTGSLQSLLERRFESYKTHVVEPFFNKHFARLDRQIVLIDLLTALNGGAKGLSDLEHGLEGVLKAFRPGANSWLSFILPRRIDRIAFAATKADHIHVSSHDRLAAILDKAVSRAATRCESSGATTTAIALAGLRATEDVDKKSGETHYHCVRGRPQTGEVIAGKRFDGSKPAVVFPGDLPREPLDAFEPETAKVGQYAFVRFAPPLLSSQGPGNGGGSANSGAPPRWKHIGLDRVFSFLFGDYLP